MTMDIPRLEITNLEIQELLSKMHNLLMAHKYDYAQGEMLNELRPLLPGAEEYYEAYDAGEVDSDAQPKALEITDSLLDLETAHVQEALHLGYMIGRAGMALSGGNNPFSVARQARHIIVHNCSINRCEVKERTHCTFHFTNPLWPPTSPTPDPRSPG